MIVVRGYLIIILKKYLIAKFSEAFYDSLVASVPEKTRAVLKGALSANEMYPIQVYNDMLAALGELKGLEVLHQFGRAKAEDQLRGFYGFVVRLLSREAIVKRMDKMFSSTYSHGYIILEVNEPKHVVIRVKHMVYTKELAIVTMALIERIVELSTGQRAQGRYQQLGDGSTQFIFELG